jgi:hypothetical protein
MKYRVVISVIVPSAIILLIGCLRSKNKISETLSQIDLLQGDWVTEKNPHGFYLTQFHINIEDSTFTMFSEYSDSVKFSINEDVIYVCDSTNTYYLGNHQKYKIASLSDEVLILIAQSNKVRKHLRNYNWNSDTLKFHKVHKKNNLNPVSIGFSSSGCFGSCPSMKIEIDNHLNVKYYGSIFSDLEGGFRGKIDRKTYNLLIAQLHNLPLNSLKPEYYAPWTDDQTRYLLIETNDTVISTRAYGTYDQPIELTIIMDNMMDLYKRLKLKKDVYLDSRKSFDNFLKMSYPIPLPPLFEEN